MAVVAAAQPLLPEGWIARIDTNPASAMYNQRFYVDTRSGLSQWEPPAQPLPPTPPAEGVLPEGWIAQTDTNPASSMYGRLFYVDTRSGLSQWEPPPAVRSTPANASPGHH
jgi:hypothetical protein